MNSKIVLGLVILVILAGGGLLLLSNSAKPSHMPLTQQTQRGSIFNSIKDALSKSLSLQCVFTNENGQNVTSYIKNGAVRSDVVAKDPTQSGSVIIKNNTVYYWSGKQGFMMTEQATPTGTLQQTPTGTTNSTSSQGDNMMASLEKYKNSCKPSVVADSLFTPPSDVTFQDMSKMMPTGAASGSYAVPTNYQQYMQQYQQKYPQGQ